MYLVIDRERMVVVCRHPNHNIVAHLSNIQFAHIHTLLFEDSEPDGISSLETVEMLRLYTSLTETVFPGFDRKVLTAKLFDLISRIAPADVNPLLVIAQSNCLPLADKGHYRYNPVGVTPIPLRKEILPPALLPGDKVFVVTQTVVPTYVPVVKSQQTGGETKYPPPWS